MGSRESWSALFVGAATLWLVFAFWLSLTSPVGGIDRLAIGLALAMQLGVVMTWDLFSRLPLWIVAGHGLITASLALGLMITAPATLAFGLAVPFYMAALVPAGVAMIFAAAVRWEHSSSLAR